MRNESVLVFDLLNSVQNSAAGHWSLWRHLRTLVFVLINWDSHLCHCTRFLKPCFPAGICLRTDSYSTTKSCIFSTILYSAWHAIRKVFFKTWPEIPHLTFHPLSSSKPETIALVSYQIYNHVWHYNFPKLKVRVFGKHTSLALLPQQKRVFGITISDKNEACEHD